jgi:hypothetical protein
VFSKKSLLALLFATTAIATPTTVEENTLTTRANWQPNKCDADIKIDSTVTISTSLGGKLTPTKNWYVDIADKQGKNIGHWLGTNPSSQHITTTKGPELWIDMNAGVDFYAPSKDGLTLHYANQHWNSKDCYKYNQETSGLFNGQTWETEWFCQFDC